MTENNFITYLKGLDGEREIILDKMDPGELKAQAGKEYVIKYSEQTPTTQLYQRGRNGSCFNQTTELKSTKKNGRDSLS